MPRNKRNRKKKRRARDDEPQSHPSQRAQNKTEHLVFEDPFEDEFEEESIVTPQESKSALAKEMEQEKVTPQVWQPSDGLGENMELDYDASAYKSFHRLRMDWPCLTLDIVRDGLGHQRSKYPQTVYIAAGTQADKATRNHIKLLKISDLHKTQNDDNSDSDEDPDDLDDDPILEEKRIPHVGGINRLRCMPQQPSIIATHADTKKVHVWEVKDQLAALDRPLMSRGGAVRPIFTFTGHSAEGWSMDWSPVTAGRMLTGDCDSHIYVWEPSNGGWAVDSKSFTDHRSSVEDLQWSPSEATVFASCSADKTIRIWDTRAKNSQLWIAAHKQDVNVISWNHKQAHLLVSGSDDGSVKVWDLREFKSSSPAAHFKWHNRPITSVQWHPSDESVIAAASADDSISFWDMGLEEDLDIVPEGPALEGIQIPSQLLFVHRGQQQIKEVRWHMQVPGLLISTALSGLNFLHPANLDSLDSSHFEGKFNKEMTIAE